MGSFPDLWTTPYQISVHDPLRGQIFHALGNTVCPLQEEPRVEAGRAEAAQIVLELASVTNKEILER